MVFTLHPNNNSDICFRFNHKIGKVSIHMQLVEKMFPVQSEIHFAFRFPPRPLDVRYDGSSEIEMTLANVMCIFKLGEVGKMTKTEIGNCGGYMCGLGGSERTNGNTRGFYVCFEGPGERRALQGVQRISEPGSF